MDQYKNSTTGNDDGDGQRVVFNGPKAQPMFTHEHSLDLPALEQGETLVKVRAATICLSDIHTVCGTRTEPTPSVLGHEACVEVVAHRRSKQQQEEEEELQLGDRCTFSIADSCGECEFCTNNLAQKCVKLFKYGHAHMSSGTGFNGCYSTHIVIRAGTRLVKLPDEIGDALAASINCALATMVNVVESLPPHVVGTPTKLSKNTKKTRRALIQGNGTLGIYGCTLLQDMGFNEVYVSGHHESDRSDIVRKFGAIATNNEVEDLAHLANQFDCVIECCGNSDVVANGIKMLRPGGAYVFAGMVHPGTAFQVTGEQIIRKCLTIQGIHNYQARHLEQAVAFLHRNLHTYPFHTLVGAREYKLDDLDKAMDAAMTKNDFRVCVRP